MTEVKLYSKLPITIQAILYTNPEDSETVMNIIEFTDEKFRIRRGGTSVITAEVYDELHDTWVGVKNGDYIIKGIKGEFYPHDGALFPQAYIESWQQEAFEIFNETPPTR
jgi:hypothetical protein